MNRNKHWGCSPTEASSETNATSCTTGSRPPTGANATGQPWNSPWASPLVLVRKRDGSHRFCVDYRSFNSVTVPDSFPLPCIDDLLDQLRESQYFSTIDLASGFWQIRMHPSSQEKTAFVVPQGLYEFRVMPFGLTNAPGVFQ